MGFRAHLHFRDGICPRNLLSGVVVSLTKPLILLLRILNLFVLSFLS